jgi:hypothetical protein
VATVALHLLAGSSRSSAIVRPSVLGARWVFQAVILRHQGRIIDERNRMVPVSSSARTIHPRSSTSIWGSRRRWQLRHRREPPG